MATLNVAENGLKIQVKCGNIDSIKMRVPE